MTPVPSQQHLRRTAAAGRATRRRASLLLAMLVLWQVLATSFHLATERHLAGAVCRGASAAVELAAHPTVAAPPADEARSAAAASSGDDLAQDLPHAPHAAIDHQVAQDRVDDDPPSVPSCWLPMVATPHLPPAVIAAHPVSGTVRPPTPWRRSATAARAPPRA